MPRATRSGQQPQHRAKQKPSRPPPADRLKSTRTRNYWRERNQAFATDPLYHLGVHFARSVHPFYEPGKLIKVEMLAIRRLKKQSRIWRHMPSKERRDHRYFLTLQHLLFLQGEEHANSTPAARVHVEKLIWKGQLAAWSKDLSSTQAMISHRLGVEFCGQGFDNETIGRLLCPVGSDWHRDKTKQTLRSAPQTMGIGPWPAVFYQNLEHDPQRPWEGFLRNNLLVMTYKLVFRATAGHDSAPPSPVTLNSIVYVATLVITALSGPNTYGRVGNQLFYKQLFTRLSDRVDEHRESLEVKELMYWWDRQFRGQKANAAPGWCTNRRSILDKFSASRRHSNFVSGDKDSTQSTASVSHTL
ncbi:hypothetical protein BKA70DRAFT_883316 [Coprinopsis sp. MPI-PUGE-AT-0042]|nr:hypothetical protein BKA70DRAFT_883316 [Coprinopsis sp. MPI-PUGE-AT-0042]